MSLLLNAEPMAAKAASAGHLLKSVHRGIDRRRLDLAAEVDVDAGFDQLRLVDAACPQTDQPNAVRILGK